MYLNKHIIEKLKKFEWSGIKKLVWDEIEDINVMVGRNGSGKSTLIETLLPQCLPRPRFKDGGKYVSYYEHRGDQYELISDYSNKDKPHEFIKNGSNLNDGGSTKVQQELIDSHLGVNQDIYDLLSMNTKLTKMKVSERKKYLSQMNPSNTNIALEMHKKVVKKIKACKSVLVNLYSRKKELEEKKISDTLFIEIMHNKEVLSNKNQVLVSWKYIIQNHLTNLKKYSTNDTNMEISKYDTKLRSIVSTLHKYKEVPRSNIDSIMNDTLSTIKSIEPQLSFIENNLQDLLAQREKLYTTQKDSKSSMESYNLLTAKIEELEKKLKTFNGLESEYNQYLSSEDIEKAKLKVSRLTTIFNAILGYQKLKSKEEIQQLNNKVTKSESLLIQKENVHVDISNRLNEVLENLSKEELFVIPNCNMTDKCDVYVRYCSNKDILNTQKKKLSSSLEELEKEITKLKKDHETLKESYGVNLYYRELYDELFDICTIQVPLHEVLKKYSKEDYANRGLQILDHILSYINTSSQYLEYESIKKELSDLKDSLIKIDKGEVVPEHIIINLIKEKTSLINKALNEQKILNSNLTKQKEKYDLYEGYLETKNIVKNINDEINKYKQSKEVELNIEYYEKVLSSICSMIEKNTTTIGRLDNDISKQEKIVYTIEEEIKKNIAKVEEELNEYTKLEIPLSPTKGFPFLLTVEFVNSIIANANVFISKVYSYPIEIVPIKPTDNFDYKFEVLLGNRIPIKDISETSMGQQSMIDLAFNFATIIQKDLTDYPVILDEIDKNFDDVHRQELVTLFRYLRDNEIVSQLHIVSHSLVTIGLSNNTLSFNEEINSNPTNFEITRYN